MNKSDALVVFSGGQGLSPRAVFLGKKTFPQSVCFKFYLWTKACEGSELARAIAGKAGVEFKAMDVSFIGTWVKIR